ncbi:MAG: tRNA 5-methoxyuridine(34)/uridine 5-oxyacetic acid(34) synthase CmoB [Calditrichaceae bacterium]|nr:tRNA 5-methoxyuridine(34)/uridine 5-oxyacetic acid(34) synthase CmoB [Calditrichaceae bacterium]MBN2710112.1 tRNA 5-methoxyuridine(34)/uridine 5-oxyacetic acid(34) synthase CmoB [Calditrichaceae bacterium]RQV93439.1 MAG: tRNA 5-methoxyuridine(34)/uridine 5-oxyacetic acid(34) synthase CmoB [Calditrichota bacterium]
MIFSTDLYTFLEKSDCRSFIPIVEGKKDIIRNHGDYKIWQSLLQQLPDVKPSLVNFNQDKVQIGLKEDISANKATQLRELLLQLQPWRKGPFDLFGIRIDAEWRSDLKWKRLVPHLDSLEGRKVLDVGCGNGYYGWRMLGGKAAFVIGIEPYLLNVIQFQAVKKYIPDTPFYIVPVGAEELPGKLEFFDAVFSMGVIYHRRSAFDHLSELFSFLNSGGQLVLETLIIKGKKGEVFCPDGRYAKMRNVWFIPSPGTLELWLQKAGFRNIRCVDITRIKTNEQRQTEWMTWESLSDFLDPADTTKTVEGWPAPVRAVFIADKP